MSTLNHHPRRAVLSEDDLRGAPVFTPAHLEYLQARFGNFKQHQSPTSLNDMIAVSHLASEQIGANKVLDHISQLIAGKEQTSQASPLKQTAAFAEGTTKTE